MKIKRKFKPLNLLVYATVLLLWCATMDYYDLPLAANILSSIVIGTVIWVLTDPIDYYGV